MSESRPPSVRSERRFAVILFAGLPGFDSFAASHKPEESRAALDSLFRSFRSAVEERGGYVDKFVGETMMAVFGAPVAHGDDAWRAVRAATDLMKSVVAFARERHAAIDVAVALHAGEVLWGEVAGDRATAIGDAVNVARRLLDEAPPGTLIATRAIERVTARLAEWAPLEPLQLRGRSEPVEAFAYAGEVSPDTESRTREGTMVGRDAELARLVEPLEAGRAAFFVLEGEAGVGKSRLAAEARRRARAAGAWVVSGHAASGVKLPLAAFSGVAAAALGARGLDTLVETVRTDLGALPPIEAENCAHLVALSIGLTVPEARVSHMDAAQLAPEMERAWGLWLRTRAAGGPAFLCVEDLQDADDRTVSLLAALARKLADSRFVICATTRPGAVLPDGFEHVRLRELSAEGAVRIAELVFGGPAEAPLARLIAEQSGGHPYYAEALARFLLDSGLVGGSPAKLLKSAHRLPEGLAGLLVARLDRLPEPTRDGLKAASVVGRSFWRRAVAVLAGPVPEAALAEAERLDLVATDPASPIPADDACQFRHALLREAAYSLLPRKERARLHALAAGWLETLPGRSAIALAAGQRAASGDTELAAGLWLAAARRAHAESAHAEAGIWAREALSLKRSPEALLLLAIVSRRIGRLDECLECAEALARDPAATPGEVAEGCIEASKVCGSRGPFDQVVSWADRALAAAPGPELEARALCYRVQGLVQLGRMTEAGVAIEEARRKCEVLPESATESRLSYLDASSRYSFEVRDFRKMEQSVREALEIRRASGDGWSIGISLNNLGVLHLKTGQFERAIEIFRETVAVRRPLGDRVGMASTLSNLGIVFAYQRRFDEALEAHEEALAIRREAEDVAGIGGSLNGIGNVHWYKGELAGAIARHREALKIRESQRDRMGIAQSLGNLATCLEQSGQVEESLEACRRAIGIYEQGGDPVSHANCLDTLSGVLRRSEGYEEGLSSARRAVAIRREVDDPALLMESLVHLSAMELNLGKVDESRAAAEEAFASARRSGSPASMGFAMHELSHVFEAAGDDETGFEWLQKAAVLTGEQWPGDGAAGCLADYAIAICRRGRVSEGAETADRAWEMAASLKTLGIHSWCRAAQAFAAAASGNVETARAKLEEAERVYPKHRRSRISRWEMRTMQIMVARELGDEAGAMAMAREFLAEATPQTGKPVVWFLEKTLRGKPWRA